MFAYPVSNGVIDTVQWEGFREGVDDICYLSTLLKLEEDGGVSIREWLCGMVDNPEMAREEIIKRILLKNQRCQ